jgi:hypothetical protein
VLLVSLLVLAMPHLSMSCAYYDPLVMTYPLQNPVPPSPELSNEPLQEPINIYTLHTNGEPSEKESIHHQKTCF